MSNEVCINIEAVETKSETPVTQTREQLLVSLNIVDNILEVYAGLSNEEFLERKKTVLVGDGAESFALISTDINEDTKTIDANFAEHEVTKQEIIDSFKASPQVTKTINNPDSEFNGWVVHSVIDDKELKIVISKVSPYPPTVDNKELVISEVTPCPQSWFSNSYCAIC